MAKRKKKANPLSNDRLIRRCDRMRNEAAAFLAEMIGQPGFEELLDVFKEIVGNMSVPEQERFTEQMRQKIAIIHQRTENGETLAEEGREKRKPITDQRTAKICRLYRRIRKSYEDGGRGNGQALREVCRQFGVIPGRDKEITVQAVRDALKRGGVVCK